MVNKNSTLKKGYIVTSTMMSPHLHSSATNNNIANSFCIRQMRRLAVGVLEGNFRCAQASSQPVLPVG
jgi:hypothetical protein